MSAVRTPVARCAANLENATGSSSSVAETLIHGYFTLNCLMTSATPAPPPSPWGRLPLVYMTSPCSFFEPAISDAIEFAAAPVDPELEGLDEVLEPVLQ